MSQKSVNSPDTSLRHLKGVGDVVWQRLQKLHLKTVNDLVENLPRGFEDFSRITKISQVRPGKVTIQASIHDVATRYSKNGLLIVEAVARDGSGQLQLTWFNQPYIKKTIKKETEYYISGEFAKNYRFFAITNPRIELVSRFPKHTARLVPLYRLTKGLSAHTLRNLIANALQTIKIQETLPEWVRNELELMPRDTALRTIHFPDDMTMFEQAKRRLAFEELFVIMLASELNRREFAKNNSFQHRIHDTVLRKFTNSLPYTLTDDQKIAAWKLLKKTTEDKPMNALLQGDVGSGKTVVSLLLAVNSLENGAQVAYMAPTELLAQQHYQTMKDLLPKGYKNNMVLLTGSLSTSEKKAAQESIITGDKTFIIGTHALIQEKAIYKNLQLVIVDEQHRFGVEQRKALQNKANKMPHVLHMSATPIPRSIALTLYGEVDIVSIKQKPSDRQTVSTKIISSDNRKELYQKRVLALIEDGEQVFVVTPLIEDSENLENKYSVEKVSKELGRWLPKARISVIHGKMKQQEKDAIMKKVKDGVVDLLIATTVIEVGIDIPNATMMVIENADSYGLAQLHQLRGRVGRGDKKSFCVLVSTENEATKRLQVMENEHSGFKLAEYDLELRGPGAIYGNMQHGALDLRIANISDRKLIETARAYANTFCEKGEKLIKYPTLDKHVSEIRSITNLN